MSYFLRPSETYCRDYDLVSAYHTDMALGLSRTTGQPYERCLEYVQRVTSKEGRLPIQDPPMRYVGRNKYGDREIKETTFLKYLEKVDTHKLIMAPSMTVYQNPHVKKSITAKYIATNVKKRASSKKEMFAAKAAKNQSLVKYKNNEQQTYKIKNNALSGAHVSDSTPLFLDTIHSSLTSTCRSATGYGNGNNEKVIKGNRHYWSHDVVVANILRVINQTDLTSFQDMMDEHDIRHPTVDETMECILYSSSNYYHSSQSQAIIHRLVSGLQDIERSVFVYVGDMYHLAKYNDAVIRRLFDRLSYRATEGVENPKQYISGMNDEEEVMVALLCGALMNGESIKAFDKFTPETQGILGATAKNLRETLADYRSLLEQILVSNTMPASMAHLPSILRRCAITSDTDSTIYTVQDWLQWFGGNISFDEKLVNVGHAVSFLASSSIAHVLAKMSANLGVVTEQLHQCEMKSEFYFPVFALTSRAKTYFAIQGAQEGQVATELDLEIKGAVLKGSNSPQFVMDEVKALIKEILSTVARDEKISLRDVISRVAKLEQRILNSIRIGETYYYKRGEIKSMDSYKQGPDRSPYMHYLLWEEVFAPKYGHVKEPPYGMIKVSIEADNNTDFKSWLSSMEDTALRDRLIDFMRKYNKAKITTINVPVPIAEISGIPVEITSGVASRRIAANLCEPLYVILESLGYYAIDDNQQRLVSDHYLPS